MTSSTLGGARRALAAAAASGAIAAGLWLGSAGAAGLPGSSPTPGAAAAQATPCPTDLTGTLCQLTATPSPTPAPTPTPKAGTPPPAGHAAAPPPAAPAATPPPGPSATSPASAAVLAQAAAAFKNAPYLGQLLDILAHPTSAQRPDLRHFRAEAASLSSGSDYHGGAGGHGILPLNPAGGALPVVLAALVAATVTTLLIVSGTLRRRLTILMRGATAHRPHPAPLHRRRLGRTGAVLAVAAGIAPAIAVAAITAPGGHGALAVGSRAAAGATGRALRGELVLDTPAPLRSAAPAWRQLLTIEAGITQQADELSAQEAEIRRVAHVVLVHRDDDDHLQLGDMVVDGQSQRLSTLVAAHAATQAAYDQSLQTEYDFYRGAAQDPVQRAALLTAASQAARPEVQDAVTYNLQELQTQLAQEQAIAGAEAQLEQFGSLAQAQLDAIRHHQPFVLPEIAPVTQPFGPTDFSMEPPLTYNGTFYPHFHTGIDLGGPLDTPVHAAADGVVLLATSSRDSKGNLVGYGNYVLIAHPDGFATLYGHLDSLAVHAGDVVRQGQIIGLEGSTGWSTGPHLHFEIRHNGEFIDPAPFVAAQIQRS